ncbi:MAG: flippase [Candidatus Colwellbacteria bacterium]|nr:flippase [Candidatus Colwellbacteria bacterium]
MPNRISRIKNFLSENRTGRQTILKNTFWLSSSEIVGRLLKAAIIIYAARVLGVAGFGTFSYVMGLASLLTAFSDLGMSPIVVREGAKNPQLRARYFSTALGLTSLLALASAVIIIFGAPLITKIPISQTLVIIVALVFVFDMIRGLVGSAIFRAQEKMEGEALVSIVTQIVLIGAGFYLLAKFRSPESLALAYAIGSAVGLILALYLVRSYIRQFIARFEKALIRPILNASIPMSLAAILGVVMINTDIVLLGWLTDATNVGLFAAAQKPVTLLYAIPSLIAASIFPALARFAGKDHNRFRLLNEKSIVAVLLFALPLTVGFLLTGEEIVNLLYGSEYLPATLTMKILALTLITMFPMSMLNNGIFAYNKQKFLVKVGAVGVTVNALLDIVLIPILGIAGCAIATVGTQVITSVSIWFKMKQINNFSVIGNLKKIIIATLLMGLAVAGLIQIGLHVLLIIILAAIIYFGTLILLKEKLFSDLKSILAS